MEYSRKYRLEKTEKRGFSMIDEKFLRSIAARENVSAGVIEKDYVLTWLLKAINQKTKKLVFRGGTALKKVYFPESWRYSEDIDFTSNNIKPEEIKSLLPEIYSIISEETGLKLSTKQFRATKWNVVVKVAYTGPYGQKSFVKIDVNFREKLIEEPIEKEIKIIYPDCRNFSVIIYTLDELLAEKIRSIIQRGKTRDYYDVWMLLKTKKFDSKKLRELVAKKCKAVDVEFDIEKIFSKENFEAVKSYWKRGLGHLVMKELPNFEIVFEELKELLE